MLGWIVRFRWLWLTIALGVGVDLVTKQVIFERLGVTDEEIHEAVQRGTARHADEQRRLDEWNEAVRAQREQGVEPSLPGPADPRLDFSFRIRHQHEIVPTYVYFTAVLNPGAFGGLLGGQVAVLLALSTFAILIVAWLLLRTNLVRYQVVCGLIIAGALGNIYDRAVFGAVRDFVDIRIPEAGISWLNPWNTFNFADAAIVGGILALLALELFYPLPDATKAVSASGIFGEGASDGGAAGVGATEGVTSAAEAQSERPVAQV